MKGKFSSMGRVAIALVLAVSLCLMTAVPAMAAGGTLVITEDYVASGDSISITVTDSALNTIPGEIETIIARVISGTEGTTLVTGETIASGVSEHTTALSVDPDAGADENQIEVDDFTFDAGGSGVSVSDVSRNTDGTVTLTLSGPTQDASATIDYTAAETALLTETLVDSGIFEGSQLVADTDAVGTLHVADGDTITASYYDTFDTSRTGDNEDTATADLVAPTYDSAITGDSATGNSSVKNKIYLKFTEAGSGLDTGTILVTDFEVTSPAIAVTGIDTVGTDYVILTLDSNLATDDIPDVTLKTGESVADAVSNTLDGPVTKAASDGLKPEVASAVAEDTNENGYLDKITLTMSETVANNVPTTVAFAVEDSQSNALTEDSVGAGGASTTSFTSTSGTVIVELSDDAGKTGEPTLVYSAGEAVEVQDLAGNVLLDATSPTVTDEAKPTVMDLDIYDTAVDGKIDKIIVTFSEYIDTNDSAAPVAADLGTITLPDGSTADLGGVTITDPTGTTDIVTITGIAGQATPNTAAGATDISGDLSTNWVDINTNLLVTTLDDETVTDSAAPVISDFEAQLGSRKATVTFSEGVYTETGEVGALAVADFAYVDDGTGAGSISLVSHTAGGDIAVVTLNAQAISGDFDGSPDTIAAASATAIYDSADNAAGTAPVDMADARNALSLVDGWNLVSIPKVASAGWDIEGNATGTLISIYTYDNGSWDPPVTDADSLDAVFIKADGPQELTLEWWTTDPQTAPPTKALEAGWNLVGANMDPPTETSVPVDQFLDSVSGSYSTVFSPGYNLSGWTVVSSGSPGSQSVLPYEGYWLYMTAADELAGRTT